VNALITGIHIIVCFILIIAVLLQSGKSADLAGAFGGGGSQTAFGPRGTATLLSKVTTICAILFMFTSLGLWMLSGRGAKSVVREDQNVPAVTETKKPAETPQPQTPAKKTSAEQKAQPKSAEPEKK
jgi:preprotein translocase subunit SecG